MEIGKISTMYVICKSVCAYNVRRSIYMYIYICIYNWIGASVYMRYICSSFFDLNWWYTYYHFTESNILKFSYDAKWVKYYYPNIYIFGGGIKCDTYNLYFNSYAGM